MDASEYDVLDDAALAVLGEHISDGLGLPAVVQVTVRNGEDSVTLRASLDFV